MARLVHLRFALVAVLALGGIASIACSAKAPGVSSAHAQEAVQAAPVKAADAGSAKFEMKIEIKGGGMGEKVTADGEMDFANSRARMHMELGGMDMDTVIMGTKVFMKTEGGAWTKQDVADLPGVGDLYAGRSGSRPDEQLDVLKGATDVEFVGREKVRGVETEHYRGKIDIMENFPRTKETAELREMMEKMLGDQLIPVEAWLDEEGRPMRFQMNVTYDFSKLGEELGEKDKIPGKMTMKLRMEFWDWGMPVVIKDPTK